jgi:D-alanyl-lipoteichoic acid acyltransferase DltB (MBOAT superfamily)
MTFVSFSFLVFFPIVVFAYYLCPARFRWALLLAASCYFYVVFVPAYLLVLFALIAVDFTMALLIERSEGSRRTHYLWVSIFATVAILFVFKYFNFFNGNLSALAHALNWNYSIGSLSLLLPLGLSFHTFQSLSYVIEVYRRRYKAERHFGIYALYVMFFPQLVAGPIERPGHLLPQLKQTVAFRSSNVLSGLRLMAWGFFKKLVIADRLALSVDYVWQHYLGVPGPSILAAIIFFAFQLYADFSGYSDIARGSARVLGIDVVRNFEQPYFSRSIAEFWRRWHISLSSWFRDYFFTPLALKWRNVYTATLFTFVVLGLWHGANWTYIIMGTLFGLYIIIGMLTKRWRERLVTRFRFTSMPLLYHALQVLSTFSIVALTNIFFRAPDVETAFLFIARLFAGWSFSWAGIAYNVQHPLALFGLNKSDLLISLGTIGLLLCVERLEERGVLAKLLRRNSPFFHACIYTILLLCVIIYSVSTTKQFIYFQF